MGVNFEKFGDFLLRAPRCFRRDGLNKGAIELWFFRWICLVETYPVKETEL